MADKEPADSPEDKFEVEEKTEKHEEHSGAEEKTTDGKAGRVKRLLHGYWAKKKLTLPLTFLLIALIVLVVPVSRYKVLGLVIKRDFSVTVMDSQTDRPVSEAEVSLGGRSVRTDSDGKAVIGQVPLGNRTLSITKQYYRDRSENVLVGLDELRNSREIKLEATGRAVQVKVTNRISGDALKEVSITALDTEAATDDKGETTIVLPAGESTVKANLKAEGYNDLDVEIDISGDVSEEKTDGNNFAMTPAGKVYFLSKRSGTIDVVKSNLDGTARETVLAGTGREQERDTVMLATRDWKYLALKSRRDGDKAKLYLIDTSTDKMTVMDEGDAEFFLTGWHDHEFVYKVVRDKENWLPKGQAIKTYDADSKQLTTMIESAAVGGEGHYASEYFDNINIVNNDVLFVTYWTGCCFADDLLADKQYRIIRMPVGGANISVLKGPAVADYDYIYVSAYSPNRLYFGLSAKTGTDEFYEYRDGELTTADIEFEAVDKEYPRFIQSPGGKTVFWAESRDGKNTVFTGSYSGDVYDDRMQVAVLDDYSPYGWFTDKYLLVSKDDSELFIMPNQSDAKPLKVTDYHKPEFDYSGYGGGY